MTSLADHQSRKSTKLLLMGHSGTGKSGALTSLVKAGYKLRILDLDNGLDSLASFVRRECPDKMANVEFRTIRDTYKKIPVSGQNPVEYSASYKWAFSTVQEMIANWKYGDVDLGSPSTWGSDTILVIDSSSLLGAAAFNWAWFMNPGSKDMRQVYGVAQDAFENIIAIVTADDLKTNVIIIAHIKYQQGQDGPTKGFATAVGQALGPIIPIYFNSVAMMEISSSGSKIERQLRVVPTAMIDLKNPAPFDFKTPVLPIETGLADFFKTVRGEK